MTPIVAPTVTQAPALPRRPMNPHYLAYCAAHGFAGDPDGMLAHDRDTAPGGPMGRFLRWIPAQERAFRLERGIPAHDLSDARWRALTNDELAAFTAWLTAAAAAPEAS